MACARYSVAVGQRWYYPDSLGRLYGAVTELLGLRAGSEEHKVQWQSTSGDARFVEKFRELVSDNARLDASYFTGLAACAVD